MHVVLKLLTSTKDKVLSTENTACYSLRNGHIREPENLFSAIIFIMLRKLEHEDEHTAWDSG